MASTGYKAKPTDKVYADGTVVIGGNKKETILIPKLYGAKEQPDVYVNVNGKTALIQRGKPVKVDVAMANVIKESLKREELAEEYYNAKANS